MANEHDLLVGIGTATLARVAPSATSGVPLISQGSSSNPTYGTAVVAGGGTGIVTTTAYGLIAGGTTATGNFQNAGTGTAGQIYVSGGASALGTWTAPTSVGVWNLIQTQSASNSSAINFTSGITSSYNTFVLVFSNIVPATAGAFLEMQLSVNGGSTYINSGYASGVNVTPYNTAVTVNGNASTLIYLSGAIANTASIGASGVVYFTGWRTANNKLTTGTGTFQADTVNIPYSSFITSLLNTASSVDAFSLFMSAGNISTGRFDLYGIT